MRSLRFVETLIQDMRYGARTLLKQPGFTSLAVLTLALGIGATTTIFSAVWNILLHPFPYRDADRMVALRFRDTSGGVVGRDPHTLELLDYQEQSHVFEDLMAANGAYVRYESGDGAELFSGCYLTPNSFKFLGIPAQLGRVITPDDARPGAPPVFVMAHKLWVKRFNQDPSILGKSFTLNGKPTTLVGIMP
ncbi:MAG: ABC transporter permease, partial [Blastocatellia bacterium]|nr:ABC transporter permease [Blastocatellia bacterium]